MGEVKNCQDIIVTHHISNDRYRYFHENNSKSSSILSFCHSDVCKIENLNRTSQHTAIYTEHSNGWGGIGGDRNSWLNPFKNI